MPTIYIDNQPYDVEKGQNLLNACLSLGLNIPYFCWHPALGSVGACRQCAVKQFKDENDTRGRLVMACLTPAEDGTRISIDDPEARAFRASVIEWLMTNHPHDCPVCDEGGECHLQDMTVMTGHTYREFEFDKRTHRNQDLGPFINHEMNRCIACYRCVRFYRDYAGGRDFDVFAAHNHVYFGRYEDGTLENEFSGNLVEICPTGVFTDKTLKQHFTRKWDLQTAPSICVHCGLGCNTIPGERYGLLRRIRNRYNSDVNGYFLCDRGRYGYEFVNSDRRIRQPLMRSGADESPQPVDAGSALKQAVAWLTDAQGVIGIGSPRASLEANFALRELVGPDHFYQGVSKRDARLVATVIDIQKQGPAHPATLHDAMQADAVFVLGEDVTNTAPMLALNLRQSVRQIPIRLAEERLNIQDWEDTAIREAIQEWEGPFCVATPAHTRLDDIATRAVYAAPDDLARLGFAVAHALNAQAPDVPDLPDDMRVLAQGIADDLRKARRPLVVSGTGCGSVAMLQAAANVAHALCADDYTAELILVAPEANSVGLGLIGGGDLDDALVALQAGVTDTVVILENDLYRRAEPELVEGLFAAAKYVMAVDHLENDTVARADAVFPAGTFAETDGTWVNNEGRAQRSYQVFVPDGEIRASWRWLRDLMIGSGRLDSGAWPVFDDVVRALAQAIPALAPIKEAAPPATLRLVGQKIPRETPRVTGRTSKHANIDVSEPKPPDDPDTPLSFSMEGYEGQPPAPLVNRYWSPGWNSVQALNKFQDEVGGPLRDGVPGFRLFEPDGRASTEYFAEIPQAFVPRDGGSLLLPLYHIFGSEELSVLTPGITERAPQPYLGLSPEQAAALAVGEGDEVTVSANGTEHRLPVVIMPHLPAGTAGIPVGLPDLHDLRLPVWGTIKKGPEA